MSRWTWGAVKPPPAALRTWPPSVAASNAAAPAKETVRTVSRGPSSTTQMARISAPTRRKLISARASL